MNSFPRKFLSLRDKSGAHHRSKSAPPGAKSRPLAADAFRSLFKADHSKHVHKDDEDETALKQKMNDIQHRLDELGITNVTSDHIKDILATKFAEGDPGKTVDFIDIEQKASAGVIAPYDPSIHMVGAENRAYVTCYLDSLLFSMFAKMDAFECVLKTNFPADDARSKLVNLLRIWVTMLRTGKLIRTDLTAVIQDTLAECGWPEARELEQQDTSEAFAFLTETLQLPLLSLQVDLFHHGKRDDDDHKVVYERLLNLAVPPDPDGKGIRLEDCLEDYFNARVDVLRDSDELKKSSTMDSRRRESMPTLIHRNTLRIMTEESERSETSKSVTASPIAMTPPPLPENSSDAGPNSEAVEPKDQSVTMQRIDPEPRSATSETFSTATGASDGAAPVRRLSARHRSTSVIQNIYLDESGRPSPTEESTATLQRAKRKGSTVVKAVTIPAWQFFRLIPWHAVTSNEPKSDSEVAMNFEQRPVVGICLKRYVMSESGQPLRHNTYIDIPDSLRLPHFMLADGSTEGEEESPGLDTDYKLVLQSVICHRGDSVHSGHYISFARVAPRVLSENRRHDFDPPPDYEEAQWVRFDDLETDGRVQYVDNIKQALKEEMPYLLFYQIVPMVDAPSSEVTEPEPPSYDYFKMSVELPSPPAVTEVNPHESRQNEIPTPSGTGTVSSPPSKPPSIRFSTDAERSRKSSDAGLNSYTDSLVNSSRRQSVAWTDSNAATPSRTPDAQSPLIGPSDESTASRLSRAAARFKGKQSRPTSQSGEHRVSSAMSRVAGLMMRPSKDALSEPSTLNISGSATSTARTSLDNSNGNGNLAPDSTLDAETEKTSVPSRSPSRRNGRHGKSKERLGKEKEKEKDKSEKEKEKEEKRAKQAAGDQPERECSVM